MNILKKVALAGVFAVVAPVMATAASITGQIDIVGNVQNSGSFVGDGGVDFDNTGPRGVLISTGSFAPAAGGEPTLFDITFGAPGDVWSVAGFTFEAASFSNVTDMSFDAFGTITGAGFDPTPGTLQFSTQGSEAFTSFSSQTLAVPVPAGILLMGTALAGFGVMRRRAKKAA